jgi:hypothetical protein
MSLLRLIQIVRESNRAATIAQRNSEPPFRYQKSGIGSKSIMPSKPRLQLNEEIKPSRYQGRAKPGDPTLHFT